MNAPGHHRENTLGVWGLSNNKLAYQLPPYAYPLCLWGDLQVKQASDGIRRMNALGSDPWI